MSSNPISPGSSPARRRARPDDSRRAERRRDEIVQTAMKLFAEKGYSETSTKDIGDEIGLLAGSLYYHIRSKEDLLYEMLLELHTVALNEMRANIATGGDPISRLRRLVRAHVFSSDVPRIRLFSTEFRHLNGERHENILSMRREYQGYVIGLIEEAMEEGLCDPDVNARAMAMAILGLLNSMPQWLHPGDPKKRDDVADSVDRLVVGGLGSERI
jgi:AcrR family transcriptional regulator